MSDPTDPTLIDFPTDYWEDQAKVINASNDVWAAIAKFVDSRMRAQLADWLKTEGDTANIACTMGTPGVDATPSATEPWGFVLVPFYGVIERVAYFTYPAGSSYTVDVKIIRPGLTLTDATTFYPGPPPSFTEDVSLATSNDWLGYVEPGTVLVFYLTAATGLRIVTANVVMRTVPS